MDVYARPVDTIRLFGTILLAAGLLMAGLAVVSDGRGEPFFLLGSLLAVTGIGLRIEAAIRAVSPTEPPR